MKILDEWGRLTGPTERGALLRREGLYHSHIQKWREAREQGGLEGLAERPAGRPAAGKAETDNELLRKENERLAAELARTKAALDIVGKAHALLELLSESADSDEKPTR
jgi:hypothetical protein